MSGWTERTFTVLRSARFPKREQGLVPGLHPGQTDMVMYSCTQRLPGWGERVTMSS